MTTEAIFQKVIPLDYRLLMVDLESGSSVILDMSRRVESVRFGLLRDEEVFSSVTTDGKRLIFYKEGEEVLEILLDTFFDLLAIDRTK